MSELYAGKIILKPAAVARLRIRDRYALHRMVLDLYPCRETDGKEESVRDVQVLGIPSRRYGEDVAAFLIPCEGCSVRPEAAIFIQTVMIQEFILTSAACSTRFHFLLPTDMEYMPTCGEVGLSTSCSQ